MAGAWLVEPATGLLRAFYGPLRAAQGRSGPLRAAQGAWWARSWWNRLQARYGPSTGLLRAAQGHHRGLQLAAPDTTDPAGRGRSHCLQASDRGTQPGQNHSSRTTPQTCPTCGNAGTCGPGSGTCRVVAGRGSAGGHTAGWAGQEALCGAVRPSDGLRPADGLVVPEMGC